MGAFVHVAPESCNDATQKQVLGWEFENAAGDRFRYVKSLSAMVDGDACIFASNAEAGGNNGFVVTTDGSKDIGASLGSVCPFAGVAVGTVTAGYYTFVQIGGIGTVTTDDGNGTAEGAALVISGTSGTIKRARTAAADEEAFVFGVALSSVASSATQCRFKFCLS